MADTVSYSLGGGGDDERLAEVRNELLGLAAGQQRLEAALAALPRAVAEAVSATESLHEDEPVRKRVSARLYRDESYEEDGPLMQRDNESLLSDDSIALQRRDAHSSWPMHVQLHENLGAGARAARRQSIVASNVKQQFKVKSSFKAENLPPEEGVEDFLLRPISRCYVFEPDSLLLIPHKVAIIVALAHDLIIQPYALAWDVPLSGQVLNTAELAVGFWCFDLALNFFVGFYQDGELIYQARYIGRRYLRTWFLPDAIAVLGDFVSLTDFVKRYLGRRFALRSIGILRIHKVASMFDSLLENSLSENARMVCKGVRLAFFMLWLNHIVCCAWYSIGVNAPSDTGGRWVDSLTELGEDEGDPQQLYRYFTAFHWSIGQIMAGGIENLGALNSIERCYSIVILLMGMLTFSSIVSALSTAMMELQLQHHEQTDKMRMLRLFLSQNSVNPKMATRVQKQVVERMQRKQHLTEKDVLALSHLSATLRAELRYVICGTHLLRMPVLRICAHIDEATVRNLCAETIDVMHLQGADPLFVMDAEAPNCYYLIEGALFYTLKTAAMTSPQEDKGQAVDSGTWVSEAALWTKWSHVGSMEATSPSEILSVNANGLVKGLLKNEFIGTIVVEYGRQFHKRLIAAVPPRSHWPTDLHVPFTDYAELVLSMSREVQEMVGQVTLHHVNKRQKMDAAAFAELCEEVNSGKCAVMMNGSGELERGVSLTVLNVERSEDRNVLVHIGKSKGGKQPSGQCQLPGTKQENQQTPQEAMEVLLDRLRPLVGQAHFMHTEQKVEWKDSPTYGMRTRYFRNIHYAMVETPPEILPRPVPQREGAEVVGRVPDIYVLVHHDDADGFDFYAWLSVADFSCLKVASTAKQEIGSWLQALDMDRVHLYLPESVMARRSRSDQTFEKEARNSSGGLEDDKLLECHINVLDVTSEVARSTTPETPSDPAKWQAEDWTVPDVPTPLQLPSNQWTMAAVYHSAASAGTEGSFADAPHEITAESTRQTGRQRRRFAVRGGDL